MTATLTCGTSVKKVSVDDGASIESLIAKEGLVGDGVVTRNGKVASLNDTIRDLDEIAVVKRHATLG